MLFVLNLLLYVLIYVCVCTCLCTCLYVFVRVYMCVCTCLCVCMHVFIYVYVRVYVCVCTCLYVYVRARACVYLCSYLGEYKKIKKHTPILQKSIHKQDHAKIQGSTIPFYYYLAPNIHFFRTQTKIIYRRLKLQKIEENS